jgi:hypothetical protein
VIVDLPDDELAAVIAALRRVIEGDKYPLSPRLDALRAALARLEAASRSADGPNSAPSPKATPKSSPKELLPAKADKRARSAKAPAAKISPGFKLGRLPPDR